MGSMFCDRFLDNRTLEGTGHISSGFLVSYVKLALDKHNTWHWLSLLVCPIQGIGSLLVC